MESAFFLMKKGCKVSCVKLIAWSVVLKEDTNTVTFHIFEYGAEFGAECSAQSGTK